MKECPICHQHTLLSELNSDRFTKEIKGICLNCGRFSITESFMDAAREAGVYNSSISIIAKKESLNSSEATRIASLSDFRKLADKYKIKISYRRGQER